MMGGVEIEAPDRKQPGGPPARRTAFPRKKLMKNARSIGKIFFLEYVALCPALFQR